MIPYGVPSDSLSLSYLPKVGKSFLISKTISTSDLFWSSKLFIDELDGWDGWTIGPSFLLAHRSQTSWYILLFWRLVRKCFKIFSAKKLKKKLKATLGTQASQGPGLGPLPHKQNSNKTVQLVLCYQRNEYFSETSKENMKKLSSIIIDFQQTFLLYIWLKFEYLRFELGSMLKEIIQPGH